MPTVALRASFHSLLQLVCLLCSWLAESCGRGQVNGYRSLSGPQRGHFPRAGYSLLWFDCGAGYILSSLALVQAFAWLSEGSSMLSGERKESCCEEKQLLHRWGDSVGDVLCGRVVAAMWVFPQANAICYKPEGCGFDSQSCHWNFSLTKSFQSHYGPEVSSASNSTRTIS